MLLPMAIPIGAPNLFEHHKTEYYVHQKENLCTVRVLVTNHSEAEYSVHIGDAA